MSEGFELAAVRVSRRRAQADEWALVLSADGLLVRVEGGAEGFAVLVPAAERDAAERALAAFERENRRPPPPPEAPAIDRNGGRHALLVAALLLASFVATGPDGGAFSERGAAAADAIRSGEWWRTLTALGLHADAGHVLGNAIGAALFLSGVFRSFGPGVGLALAIAAGGLGNGANALIRTAAHSTIGASTAVFGALGVVVGERMVRRRATPSRQAAWIPLGAGLALVAMLGTEGERVDVWAHVLGLAAGIVLGAAATQIPTRWLARPLHQLAIGAAALALVAFAWLRALAA